MSLTDQIAAAGALFTGVAALVALAAFIYTGHQYRNDQRQQRAAQTREVLQAIIADCSRFLRPLTGEYPYPILHTATDISKEFCSRMGEHPQREDVLKLLRNEKLLRSICVEGWINSTQIFRMLSIAEEVERKASSHYLRGKLLLIQDRICSEFEHHYSQTIKRSLYFIQMAANAFIRLSDTYLLDFAKAEEEHAPLASQIDSVNESKQVYDHLEWVKKRLDALDPARMEKKWVKKRLDAFHLGSRNTSRITPDDYTELCKLIGLIEAAPNPGFKASPIEQTAIS